MYVNENENKDQNQICLWLLNSLINQRSADGRSLIDSFLNDSLSNFNMSIIDIQNKIHNNHYLDIESFVNDIQNCFKIVNESIDPNSQDYLDCFELNQTFTKNLQTLQLTHMEQKDKREDIFLTSDSKKTLYCEEKSNNEKISKQEEEYEHINELINYIINYHDPTTNQLLCEAFKMLPSRNEYPDYYDIIKEPIDLTMIMEHINNVEYDSLTSLYKDLTLMVKNAKTYNEPGSWIYKVLHNI
ncbi:unnamed protein product [Gordionus sp. m RMFG-2023]